MSGDIPLSRPWLGDEELAALARPVERGWLLQGEEVAAFERELAAYTGAAHACAVASGTAALQLALRAAGVGPGDEVITVSHSFVATANSIRLAGASPVFVDIEPGTLNLDARQLPAVVSPRTRAILAVHQLGLPCDLGAILAFARPRGLLVVEDAACAIGSEIDLGEGFEKIGRPHADLACFSFHPRKLVTTGDGGMVTSARADWDQAMRRWRNHGGMGEHLDLAGNFRMTELQAAVGRVQLGRLPEMLARRAAQVERYRAALDGVVAFPAVPSWARPNWQSLCVRLPDERPAAPLVAALAAQGIASRTGVHCAHRLPVYRAEPWGCAGRPCACSPGSCARLRESERAEDQSLILPLYHQLTDEEIDRVSAAVRSLL